MKQVYGYIRTSNKSLKRALDSDSYPRQQKAIKDFAKTKRWTVKRWFSDVGVSGDTGFDLSTRQAWSDMVTEMKANGVKAFAVASSDRLARSVVTHEILRQDLVAHGIEAFDASTGYSLTQAKEDDPEASLITGILRQLAEFEKVKLVEKLQAGKRRAKKKGKYIGGERPYGYFDGEDKLVSRILELRKLSLQKIANRLHEEGFRPRRAERFSRQQIHYILKANKKRRSKAA
tara:strand:- start:2554 stop:3249 length:696 start_codon:yes stop_codon:yes gene_type:complete